MRSIITKFAVSVAPMALTLSVATAVTITVIPAPAMAREKKDQQISKLKPLIGKAYFLIPYSGLPTAKRRYITQNEVDIATYFDLICQGDLKAQRPDGVSEYFHSVLFGVLGTGGGYAAGYGAAGYDAKTVKVGVKVGVGVGLVSGLVNGIDGRKRANRYDIGQCMLQMINWAQQYDNTMLGIGVIMNTHAVNGKGLKYMTIVDSNTPLNNASSGGNGTTPNPTAKQPAVIP